MTEGQVSWNSCTSFVLIARVTDLHDQYNWIFLASQHCSASFWRQQTSKYHKTSAPYICHPLVHLIVCPRMASFPHLGLQFPGCLFGLLWIVTSDLCPQVKPSCLCIHHESFTVSAYCECQPSISYGIGCLR